MKYILFLIAAFSIAFVMECFAQTENRAIVIGCGGGFSTSGAYAGNSTIGLPFAGLFSNFGKDTVRLGMYDDTVVVSPPKKILTAYPAILNFGSIPTGNSSNNSFVVRNSSIGGETAIPISFGASSDPVFNLNGNANVTLHTGDSIVVNVKYSSDGKSHIGFTIVSSPGLPSDTIIFSSALSDVLISNESASNHPIFPNPSTGTFTINEPNPGSYARASVYDEHGSFVLDATRSMTRVNGHLQFSFDNLPSGVYLLILNNAKEHYSYKLSIRK